MAGSTKKPNDTSPPVGKDSLPREKLPPTLQKIVDKADKEENFYDELWEGT
jgi:fission process protein 1